MYSLRASPGSSSHSSLACWRQWFCTDRGAPSRSVGRIWHVVASRRRSPGVLEGVAARRGRRSSSRRQRRCRLRPATIRRCWSSTGSPNTTAPAAACWSARRPSRSRSTRRSRTASSPAAPARPRACRPGRRGPTRMSGSSTAAPSTTSRAARPWPAVRPNRSRSARRPRTASSRVPCAPRSMPRRWPPRCPARPAGQVWVADGFPEYHHEGCGELDGLTPEPIPYDQAVEDGFQPCVVCNPDLEFAASAAVPPAAAAAAVIREVWVADGHPEYHVDRCTGWPVSSPSRSRTTRPSPTVSSPAWSATPMRRSPVRSPSRSHRSRR